MRFLVYANCQGIIFEQFLPILISKSIEMVRFENYRVISGEQSIEAVINAARCADVVIYQPLGSDHGACSTIEGEGTVGSAMNRDALKISMPYVYNDALWPLILDGQKINNGSVIEELLDLGATKEEILDLYDSDRIDFQYERRFIETCNIAEQREQPLDIQVTSLMKSMVQNCPLMLTQNHPGTAIFADILRQFLALAMWKSAEADSWIAKAQTTYGPNIAGLPGRWPLHKSALDHYNFKYERWPDESAHLLYRNFVETICNNRQL